MRCGCLSTLGLGGAQHHWQCGGRIDRGTVPRSCLPLCHCCRLKTATSEHPNQRTVDCHIHGVIWRRIGSFHHRSDGSKIGYSGPAPDRINIFCFHDLDVGALAAHWEEKRMIRLWLGYSTTSDGFTMRFSYYGPDLILDTTIDSFAVTCFPRSPQ